MRVRRARIALQVIQILLLVVCKLILQPALGSIGSLHIAQHRDNLLTIVDYSAALMLCVEQLLVRLSACLMLFNKSQGRTTYYLQAIALEGLLHNVLCSLAYLVQCLLVYILLVCQGLRGSFQCLAGSNQQCLIQAFKMPNLQRLLQLQVQQLLSALLYSVICSCSSLLFLHALTLSVKLVVRVRNLLLLHVGQNYNKGQLASCAEHLLIGLLVILYIIR